MVDLTCFMQVVCKHIRPEQALSILSEINFSDLLHGERDMNALIGVVIHHTTAEQEQLILKEFAEADTDGHCPVCYEKDVPVDHEGKRVDLESEAFYEYARQHTGQCPVMLLGTMAWTVEHL